MPGYPQITDYNEAVQHPGTAFLDGELRLGRVRENALGLPVVLSGGFALTYMVVAAGRKIAVRCFHREIPAVEQKYAAISRAFRDLHSPYFVDFDFLTDGIRVHRQVLPIVKMDWAEGDVLGLWLSRNCTSRRALASARKQFADLAAYLEDRGIAHGDVQNGNIIVSAQGIKIIDYDGVHVPGMVVGKGSESGHKHFQHPQRDGRHHGPQVDRFSFIVIDLSLAALIEDPSLFRRYGEGGETILFHANDFADPDHSEVFGTISRLPGLQGAAQTLAAICQGPIETVPTLSEFAGLSETGGAARPVTRVIEHVGGPPRPKPADYIGTHAVIDAKDFLAVMSRVGQRVELIGRVASVESGSVKGGKRHGLPCLYVNLLKRWRQVVRITIWSENGGFDEGAGQGWVGEHLSATGLIGQPFVSDAFLKPRTEIGIALDDPSQLNFISAAEAERRLAQSLSKPVTELCLTLAPQTLSNRQMVSRLAGQTKLLAPTGGKISPMPNAPPGGTVLRPNRAIINRLQRSPRPLAQPRAQPAVAAPAPAPAPRALRTGPVPSMVIRPRKPGS